MVILKCYVRIQGYYIDRPKVENPWGEYKVQLVMDSYLDIVSLMGATGLVKYYQIMVTS
jgi:hypothetical protein